MILHGNCVSPGVARGTARNVNLESLLVTVSTTLSSLTPQRELKRFTSAARRAVAQLGKMQEGLARQGQATDALIFEAHVTIISDPDFNAAITAGIVERGLSTEAAVAQATGAYHAQFASSESSMIRDKAADVLDIGRRLIQSLSVLGASELLSGDVIVAPTVTPSELVRFAHQGVVAVIATTCGLKSHTAILARGFRIPLLAGVQELREVIPNGAHVLVDASAGVAIVDPTEEERETARSILKQLRTTSSAQPEVVEPPVTRDDVRVGLLVNISDPLEAETVPELAVDGVGLFRTEFLYMDRMDWPTEEESYAIYHRVASRIGNGELNIRLADFGAEKCPIYANIPINRNPSLGIRGVRLLLWREDILQPQARAIARVARERPVTVLLPMIDSLDTLTAINRRLCAICGCDDREQLPFRVGVMIEVPSAALMIDGIIQHADTVAVGLNDLTQYVLAADRDDELVESYHDALQPAVLRLVRQVVVSAANHDKPVTMCGELAGDRMLTAVLLALGVRRFSVSRSHVQGVASLIRQQSIRELEVHADQLLQLNSGADVRQYVAERLEATA